MYTFDIKNFRSQFPLLNRTLNNADLVYFDNAATTQKPSCVIDKYQEYYQQYNANVHRASHQLSTASTSAFENARETVKQFINAENKEEIIWTKGTTESVNLLASSLGHLVIQPGDEILLSQSEHHANIVPWQIIAEKKSAIIKVIPLTDEGIIDTKALKSLISSKTKLISFAHISNVIGKINPINEIISICKLYHIITVIDGAQAIAHEVVDVQALDCDFYLFSSHKMYGPTGVGVLYGKRYLLNKMPPYQGGGEMIEKVSFKRTTYNTLPFKFEAGTPNISGIIAFSEALKFISHSDFKSMIQHENTLLDYCYDQLTKIDALKFVSADKPNIPLFSFFINGFHNHDVASYLDAHNIAVRAGHHCAMPLMEYLKIDGCIRIALSAYNTIEEIDYFIKVIKQLIAGAHTESTVANKCELGAPITHDHILHKFSALKGWDSRHRELMLLGKSYKRIPKVLLTDDNLVKGCESNAWLTYEKVGEVFIFKADSDAKVIRGLLTIILAAYDMKTPKEILTFDIDAYFNELGLKQHLSPSRTNGLIAIVKKIKCIASC